MAKLRLNKALHQTLLSLLKHLVRLGNILELEAMCEHDRWVDLAGLDELEDLFPVFVDGGLAASNHLDAAFHEGAYVEVVGVWEDS